MSVKRDLCKALRVRKEDLGWTYDEIHEKSGVAKSQLINIFCHGGEKSSIETIERLAKVLGTEFELHAIYHVNEEFPLPKF